MACKRVADHHGSHRRHHTCTLPPCAKMHDRLTVLLLGSSTRTRSAASSQSPHARGGALVASSAWQMLFRSLKLASTRPRFLCRPPSSRFCTSQRLHPARRRPPSYPAQRRSPKAVGAATGNMLPLIPSQQTTFAILLRCRYHHVYRHSRQSLTRRPVRMRSPVHASHTWNPCRGQHRRCWIRHRRLRRPPVQPGRQ